MIKMLRASGIAAAAVTFVAAAAFADPSFASDANVAPAVNPVLEHSAATISDSAAPYGFGAPAAQTPVQAPAPAPAVTQPVQAPVQAAPAPTTAAQAYANRAMTIANAAVPRPRTLNELVSAYSATYTKGPEEECLASAIYFEARGESLDGQLAVAQVVLNRAASGRYPSTICKVVTQPWQFSFIQHGRFPSADKRSRAWSDAVAIARIAQQKLAGKLKANVLWYHADYVAPSWGRRLTRVEKIGAHIFYS